MFHTDSLYNSCAAAGNMQNETSKNDESHGPKKCYINLF